MNSGNQSIYKQNKKGKTRKSTENTIQARSYTAQLISSLGNQVLQGFFKVLPSYNNSFSVNQHQADAENNPVIQQMSTAPVKGHVSQFMVPRFGTDVSGTVTQRQAAPNITGLPDSLKTGIEGLSGIRMDKVRVHYNSSIPARLNAYAHTQGTDIHVAPGQERHLPHEAWHVVQQAQGRVQPTTIVEGMPVNDSPVLEHEADVMGVRALSTTTLQRREADGQANSSPSTLQMKPTDFVGSPVLKLNPGWGFLGFGITSWGMLKNAVKNYTVFKDTSALPGSSLKKQNLIYRKEYLEQMLRSIKQWESHHLTKRGQSKITSNQLNDDEINKIVAINELEPQIKTEFEELEYEAKKIGLETEIVKTDLEINPIIDDTIVQNLIEESENTYKGLLKGDILMLRNTTERNHKVIALGQTIFSHMFMADSVVVHAGIYDGNGNILEASGGEGLRKVSLKDKPHGYIYEVYRFKKDRTIADAASDIAMSLVERREKAKDEWLSHKDLTDEIHNAILKERDKANIYGHYSKMAAFHGLFGFSNYGVFARRDLKKLTKSLDGKDQAGKSEYAYQTKFTKRGFYCSNLVVESYNMASILNGGSIKDPVFQLDHRTVTPKKLQSVLRQTTMSWDTKGKYITLGDTETLKAQLKKQ